MPETTNLFFVALVLVTGVVTYIIKYGAKIEYNAISRLEWQIEEKKEAIDILNANWALLTDPARIQNLVEHHNDELQLKSMSPDQVIDINQIPFEFPAGQESFDERMAGGLVIDSDILTGSVRQGDQKE